MEDTDQRYTPESVLEVVRAHGVIALDPCTFEGNPTKARHYFTAKTDGLQSAWPVSSGELAFVNPPYSRGQLFRWAHKVVCEAERPLSEIIVLTPADLGTKWGTLLFSSAAAVAHWRGRIAFVKPDGTYDTGAKQPSVFWYFGERVGRFRRVFGPHANVALLGGW